MKKRVRKFCNTNRMAFQRTLSLVDWSLLDNVQDPDFAMSVFHEVLFYLYDSCFPEATVRFTSRDPPWVSVSLKILLNQRDHAFNKGRMWLFRTLRSKAIRLIANLKKRYLERMERMSSNRGMQWKGIRLISRNTKNVCSPVGFSVKKLNDFLVLCSNETLTPFVIMIFFLLYRRIPL